MTIKTYSSKNLNIFLVRSCMVAGHVVKEHEHYATLIIEKPIPGEDLETFLQAIEKGVREHAQN